MICNNCKSTVRDGSAFCTKCGARMVQPAVPRPAPAPVQTPAYNPAPAPKKKTGAGIIIGIVLLLLVIGAEAWYLVNWYNNEGGFFPETSFVSRSDDEDEEKPKDKDKDKDTDKDEKPGSTDVIEPEPKPSDSASLPGGAELKSDASVEEIVGDWVGELTFTRLDG
ncbi:MAG: zinc ribbon domain-containing protein, partial [Oscillospiraceae bacterium]|nr:zinc ribbon domain-containing protein [Oscillospiraceae bacterium]